MTDKKTHFNTTVDATTIQDWLQSVTAIYLKPDAMCAMSPLTSLIWAELPLSQIRWKETQRKNKAGNQKQKVHWIPFVLSQTSKGDRV